MPVKEFYDKMRAGSLPTTSQCKRTRTGMRADRGTDISDHKIFISKTFFNQIGNKLCIAADVSLRQLQL